MKITPIAFESLGVRSQCTLVETKDIRILIDPAVSLAPRRYGLPPHQNEVDKLNELKRKIESTDAELIIVTHYHYDHHDPGYVVSNEIYRNKTVLIKDPLNFINVSQKVFRAPKFLKSIEKKASEVQIGDGKKFEIGSTKINISNPVPHGADERLGYVIQVAISDKDDTVLFTSDIEGAPRGEHLAFTNEIRPGIIVIDGPLSYLLGRAWNEETLNNAMKNMEYFMRLGLHTAIIDHHVLRDLEYQRVLAPVIDVAKSAGVKVVTAAEYLGMENLQLEARRRELYTYENKPGKLTRNMLNLMDS
ncbi:hypothetical protein HS7_10240 [Sulfolobales archaeon HS-7]|nr:hypothetical protein HS7_10240 [Sulfolobales archaeon HS-7]